MAPSLIYSMATKKKPKHEKITTERFFREQAEHLKLKLIAGESGLGRTIIEPTVNRPSLALAGFTKYIAYKRIQVIGNAEAYYLCLLYTSPSPRD